MRGRLVVDAIAFLVMFAVALICVIWPEKIQEFALKQIGDPDNISERIPKSLQPLARRVKKLDYNSKAGSDYIQVLRVIGVLGLVIMLVALILVLNRHV